MSASQCLVSGPCSPCVLLPEQNNDAAVTPGPCTPCVRLPEQNNDASVLTVGERFESFAELEQRITSSNERITSTANSVQLWKRDARTIEAAKKRVVKIASKMPAALKYYQLRFCCIHGGMKFVSSNKGARKSSTFKKDCEFSIYVAANKEGSHLEVRSVKPRAQPSRGTTTLSTAFPSRDDYPPDLKAKARHLLKLRANKMLVREQIQRESGHAVSLKDLSNISAEGKRAEPRNNLPEVVRILQEKHKAAVRLLTDENNELQALYFQDEHMKASFEAYAELIFVDAT
ncbi:hypothetical protein HPB48_022559 [Haemaphysalis longicornis]|uniref:Uncharacterized protein n=1 Tax=Haemaphysalis longicornis TaxID=44386 RepID=A0A9J6FDZ2_HAELO|nr:hypothetical protein HPB48_022559 [Haemaphysalis longicornis]